MDTDESNQSMLYIILKEIKGGKEPRMLIPRGRIDLIFRDIQTIREHDRGEDILIIVTRFKSDVEDDEIIKTWLESQDWKVIFQRVVNHDDDFIY
jgi:hypothetical protein